VASLVYNLGSFRLQDRTADYVADDIEVILVKSTYTPNKDDTNSVYAAAELGAISGYVPGFGGAGRKLLGSKTITNDTTNDRTVYDAADPSAWTLATGETVGGAIVGKKGSADDTTAIPLFFVDFTDTPTNGGTFTLQFSASGIAYTQQ
jgi:TctA family transporter